MTEPKSNVPADLTNLPGNSYAGKQAKPKKAESAPDRKPPEKIVSGEVIRKKKTGLAKLKENLGGDDMKSVGSYIVWDVFIPAAKDMINDAIRLGTERLIYGESKPRGVARGGGRQSGYSTYSSMYKPVERPQQQRSLSRRTEQTQSFDEVTIKDRGEAEQIIEQLLVLIEDYGQAKVSDLYSMLGITASYVDDRWGWLDLSSASSRRVREGYLLDLPPAVPLNV